MKIFKIILILALLVSVSVGVFGEATKAIYCENLPLYMKLEILNDWFTYHVSIDEKFEIYDWWQEKNVEKEEVELTIDEPEQILFRHVTEGEFAKEFKIRPSTNPCQV